MEKSNIQHLKDILKEFEGWDSLKTAEAEEFLGFIEGEMKEKDDKISELEFENDDEDKEIEFDNRDFVGLDTINWSLDNGNLKIQMQMENFIHNLKKQNLVTT